MLDPDKVFYCKSCHSLCVVVDDTLADDCWDGSYCGKCNSVNIGTCSLDEWLEEEKRREDLQKMIEWNR